MSERFDPSRAPERTFCRFLPVIDGTFEDSGLREVMSHDLGVCLGNFGKTVFERIAYAPVQFLAGAAQQDAIGGILDKSVFEHEGDAGRRAGAENEASLHQLIEC